MNNDFLPALYGSADDLSNRIQKKFITSFFLHILLLVLSAILSVVAYLDKKISIIQTVLLVIITFLSFYLTSEKPEKKWYGARAIAESIKSSSLKYMMHSEPFDVANEDARKKFREIIKNICEQNSLITGLLEENLSGRQITPSMLEIRNGDLASRKSFYLQNRIDDQLKWYEKKSKSNRKISRYCHAALIASNILALTSSCIRIIFPSESFWPTDIFLALSASILAWLQVKKYSELAGSYSLAANEISIIRDEFDDVHSENEFSVFVSDSENAFSREHTQWISRKDA